MGNVSPLQPQPQVAVVAVDLVPSDPAEGHSRFQRPLQHPPGQLRLGAECHLLRHPSLSPPFQVISPHPRQVEFPVQQGPPLGRGVGQKYPDLAVLDPPRRAAILPLHPNGLVPLLQKSRLVHHQNSMDVAQMLHHVVPEIVANQVGVPDVGGQQVLHPIGGGVPRLLRQLPAVLAFHGTEQPPQVVQRPPTRLGTPESSRNALVYPFDSPGPTGHLRHIFYHTYHRLTSPALDCLDSTRLCSATVVLEQTIASGDPELYSPFIPEVAGLLSKELQLPNGATLLNAYQVIPSQQFSGVLDSVKTKLLAFVLELERSNVTPEAVSNGDVEPGLVRAAVSINIYGNNNVVASGQDIHQELKGIQKGDLDSLVGYLRFHNVCDEDLRELKDVVSVEPGPTNGGFGPKVSAFIGKLVEKAAGGTWKIGLEKASAVLGESFKTFYGI